jgi:hypothetical protein
VAADGQRFARAIVRILHEDLSAHSLRSWWLWRPTLNGTRHRGELVPEIYC